MESDHPVFKNDPVDLYSRLYKKVTVTMKNMHVHKGYVYTIDPVTESYILVMLSDDFKIEEILLLVGFNIKNVEVHEDILSDHLISLINRTFKKEEVTMSSKEVESRREVLCVWLSDNRVPYKVISGKAIEVLETAVINPPYTTNSVHCNNEVILDKVLKLISNAPSIKEI